MSEINYIFDHQPDIEYQDIAKVTPIKYKTYNYRFVILVLCSLCSIMGIMMATCFLSLQTLLVDLYGENLSFVNFSSVLVFNLAYFPSVILGSFIVGKFGLRIAFLFASGLIMIGLWIRVLSNIDFLYILLGQSLGGLAMSIFSTNLGKISTTWFAASERPLATTVMTQLNNLGLACGFFLPKFFISDSAIAEKAVEEINQMMISMAIGGSVIFILVLALFKERPETPPSHAAESVQMNFKESFESMWKNKNFLVMLLGTAILFGSFLNFISIVEPLIKPFTLSNDEIGASCTIGVVCGIIPSLLIGNLVNKRKMFKLCLVFVSSISLLILCVLILIADSLNVLAIKGLIIGYIAMMVPVLPLSYGILAEVAFPVPEYISCGLYFLINQAIGVALPLLICSVITEQTLRECDIAISIIISVQAAGILLVMISKEELRRDQYEKQKMIDQMSVYDRPSPSTANSLTL